MDKEKIRKAITELLEAVGENPSRNGLRKTPKRIADMLEEILSGKNRNIKNISQRIEELKHDDMVFLRNIKFYSMCEHHLLPFFGTCDIAYIPKSGRIAGIGNLAEIVDIKSRRLQVQERLTAQIADAIMKELRPKSAGVVIKARHLCMEMRSLKQQRGTIITSAMRGAFKKDNKELIKNILNCK